MIARARRAGLAAAACLADLPAGPPGPLAGFPL